MANSAGGTVGRSEARITRSAMPSVGNPSGGIAGQPLQTYSKVLKVVSG
jgi:hypothetical protein